MNRVTPLVALLVGLPLAVTAQTGVVQYDQATRLDINLPPNSPFANRMPRNMVKPMQLTFTPEATLFGPGVQKEGAQTMRGDFAVSPGMPMETMRSGGGNVEVVRFAGGARFGFGGASDAVAGAYTDLASGSFTEVREFLGRTFRIPTERPSFAWKLTGEQASFLGHPVFQAIAQQDSTKIEAWFTPDIPVPAGPAEYGGLPGLILTLAVDSNRIVYTATSIDLQKKVEPIKAPNEGSKVTRAEYNKIVEEKTAEMEKSRGGRRN